MISYIVSSFCSLHPRYLSSISIERWDNTDSSHPCRESFTFSLIIGAHSLHGLARACLIGVAYDIPGTLTGQFQRIELIMILWEIDHRNVAADGPIKSE